MVLDIMTLQEAMVEMREAGGFHMSRQTMILAIKQHPDMFPFVHVIETVKQRRYIIFRPKFEKWLREHEDVQRIQREDDTGEQEAG